MPIPRHLLFPVWKQPTLISSYPTFIKHFSVTYLQYLKTISTAFTHFRSASSLTQFDTQQNLSQIPALQKSQNAFEKISHVWGEKSVGITEHLSASVPGFSGIVKHRYSDFLVNEIDQHGEVVLLTDTSVPEVTTLENSKEEKRMFSLQDSLSDLTTLLHDKDITQNIRNLFESKGQNPSSVFIEGIAGKEDRTKIHHFFKNSFDRKLTTDTVDGCIKVEYVSDTTGHRDKRFWRKQDNWSVAQGDFCQFVLYKENKDTIEAVNTIAKMMKLSSKVFSYAGTKDKRGITTQLVTGRHVKAERLYGLNKSLRGIRLGNFKYSSNKIDLGDLQGNRFVITIRDISTDSIDIIDKALSAIRDKGFINYFGMQRFGTKTAPTHVIGKALLLGNWEQAVDLILMPREGEVGNIAEARQVWAKTRDAKRAIKLYPKRCVAESYILSILAQSGRDRDFLGAISTIPRNLRMMYVHAYQSYIWNCMVSRRIRRYGSGTPVVGDLVLDECKLSSEASGRKVDGVEPKLCAKVLTPADVSHYTIYDVVLPLPGYDVVYPEHEIAREYHTLMGEDGLCPNDMHRKIKEFSLPGTYRKCITKPRDVSWEVFEYSNPEAPLMASNAEAFVMNTSQTSNPTRDGNMRALRLTFSLSPSQYATMALRELLKA